MASPDLDVLAIGNAIVDVIARCEDGFLSRHGLPKGHMRLIDETGMSSLYADMGPAVEVSGGSAANTAVGVASLGGKSGFIGKVADDALGQIFAHDIRAAGVTFESSPAKGAAPTARCLILVTPDGQRTMNTFLGVSPELSIAEVDHGLIGRAKILYLEGYLFDLPAAKAAFYAAAKKMREAGGKVALSLSDGFCVDRHRDEFLKLIRGGVDILFANESEATALYQTSDFDAAVAAVAKDAPLAAVTCGPKGAVIARGGERVCVPAEPVAGVVDTTGAGDQFAAGFLAAYVRNASLERAGRLGCLAAAEVIGHVGPRPETSLAALARSRGLL